MYDTNLHPEKFVRKPLVEITTHVATHWNRQSNPSMGGQENQDSSPTGMREGFNTEGNENGIRCNQLLHKAGFALFQHRQHVGNLHLNRMANLWGETCSSNSPLSQILPKAWGHEHGEVKLLHMQCLWKCSNAPLWRSVKKQEQNFAIKMICFQSLFYRISFWEDKKRPDMVWSFLIKPEYQKIDSFILFWPYQRLLHVFKWLFFFLN